MRTITLIMIGLGFFGLAAGNNEIRDEIIFSDVLNGKEITRLENYLVYYKYNSSGRTPANEWGYEISVNGENYVVETGTNVNVYPGGYAISGHGTKKELLTRVRVGDIVEIDHGSLAIAVKRNPVLSAAFLVEKNYADAQGWAAAAADNYLRRDEAAISNLLNELADEYQKTRAIIEQGNYTAATVETLEKIAGRCEEIAFEIRYRTVNSEPLEIRALWHRPNASGISESNLAGVKSFTAKVKELGFNAIYVETFWNGYASYRSDILETHPQVAYYYYGEEYGHDYIAALIGEAKKAGIDVFAWCHTFNAGNNAYRAKAVKDEWLLEDYQGNKLHPNVYGGSYYLDPSHPEALDFIESVFVEMTEKYDFAGIQFDYIRYYDNDYRASPVRDSGFGAHSENKFKEATGLSGDVRTLVLNTAYREKWNEWRQANITAAVKRFSEAIRAARSDIAISAAVVANVNIARDTYMQDWPTWVNRGYIDLLCPMIYTGSAAAVAEGARAIKNRAGNLSHLAAGIAPIYYGYSNLVALEETLSAGRYGGASHFASQNVIGDPAFEAALRNGAYRTASISPLSPAGVVFEKAMEDLLAYCEYYRDAAGDNYSVVKNEIDEIAGMRRENPADYEEIIKRLKHLRLITAYLSGDSLRENVNQKITRLIDVLDVKISRELIAMGYYDPESGPRPDAASFDYPSPGLPPVAPGNGDKPKKGCFAGQGLIALALIGLLYFRRRKEHAS
ncbi:MAG: family 10 glycosylhydrolase [Bacilli bacterium]